MIGYKASLFTFLIAISALAGAQSPKRYTSSEIQQALLKMNVLGTVLYVAAHPDDENTRLITWLSNDRMMNTGYLSLTRGDGGQNLIGSESGEQLGMIRTQELLQARRVDGGRQFFSRANDFGFSKDADETFQTWNREKLLSDVVWTIRKFRPDVIITRFSPEPYKTHGHHTASAMLAQEAFSAAGDKTRFPEQLKYVEVWQAKRIVWNTSYFFFGSQENFEKADKSEFMVTEVGTYNPLLGKSYNEIAAESRSMHKSQGFGSTGSRGSSVEYFKHLKGSKAKSNLFEGINTTWARVPGGNEVGEILKRAADNYDPLDPSKSVPELVRAKKALQKLPNNYWKGVKSEELKTIIAACMGLYLEATAASFNILPGENVQVKVEVINRSAAQAELRNVSFPEAVKDTDVNLTLKENQLITFNTRIKVPDNAPYSQPYWLRNPHKAGQFEIEDQQEIGLAENEPPLKVVFSLLINREPIEFELPVVFKKNDPVEGEQYRPLQIVPEITIQLSEQVYVFPDQQPRDIEVQVNTGIKTRGTLFLTTPHGWRSYPDSFTFETTKAGELKTFVFKVVPSKFESEGTIQAFARAGEKEFTRGIAIIKYPHIPAQTMFPTATSKVVRLDLKKKGTQIGYLQGAGDEIPASLTQVGYNVTILQHADMNLDALKKFDAVIIGIRAYNTQEKLLQYQSTLLEYVKKGGNMIVQYNTSASLLTKDLAPYSLKISNERVAMENVPVRILLPKHPVMKSPNKITPDDFENWVQERGLYFPSEWSPEFDAVLSSNDPGETPKDGGLLVARYGKGNYIYTTYSWFRQLPAGVPGAYRLFANIIAIGR
jgi:LmbE family N-acetylglucosaminyl deacetylase